MEVWKVSINKIHFKNVPYNMATIFLSPPCVKGIHSRALSDAQFSDNQTPGRSFGHIPSPESG